MWDMNKKIFKCGEGNFIGTSGLETRNKSGERLAVCLEFITTVSYYDLPAKRLYTWRYPADNFYYIIRNKTDWLYPYQQKTYKLLLVNPNRPWADMDLNRNLLIGK